MLMNAADYRESLRRYWPRVFVDGRAVESVADAPLLRARHRRASASPTTSRCAQEHRRR